MSFNDAQKRAATFKDGPCLVIAGPGSGKTHTMIHRIKYLINELDVKAHNILVISFNKTAVLELKQRFLKLNNGNGKGVYFATFHSLFFAILKNAYNLGNDSIVTKKIQIEIIKTEILKYELEYNNEDEIIDMILSEIGLIKNDDLNIDEYKSKTIPYVSFRKIYKTYEEKIKKRGLIDFDDFAKMTVDKLREDENLRNSLKERFKYILIDEFQDINKVQMQAISLICSKANNLFVVGDDDQSIYKFRGSNPAIMLGFLKDYPDATSIYLNINYRCTKPIIDAANKLISNNKLRYEKSLVCANKAGSDIKYLTVSDINEEKKFLVSEIKKLISMGVCLKDIAILTRTNALASPFIKELRNLGIGLNSGNYTSNAFNGLVASDISSYLKIAMGCRDRVEFLHIINKPMRYITRSFLNNPVSLCDLKNIYLLDKNRNSTVLNEIDKLIFDLKIIKDMSPFAAINYIRKGIGYERFILDYSSKISANKDLLVDDLEKITEASKSFKSINEFLNFLEEKKNVVKERPEEGVNFYTFHRSKGLEFKVVFIIDACEDIIPLKQALLEEDIEEERRLFYVGITRTKELLYIISPKERYNKEYVPSRFIEEMGLEEK